MATATSFSVFPSSSPNVPRISVPTPHNRKPSLKTVKQLDSFKESVVIALEEIPVPKIPEDQVQKSSPTGRTLVGSSSPALKNGIPPPPPIPDNFRSKSSNGNPKHSHGSYHSSPEPTSISSSETLVSGLSPRSDENVVPIRSMFPVYNPNVPLNQQSYYPQRPNISYDPRQQTSDTQAYSARKYLSPSARDSTLSRTNHQSIVDVPLDVLNFKEPGFSSIKDLERLWEATSTSELNAAAASFDLEFGRLDEATFTFGSSPDVPFYSITTYDTSEISVTKTCPRKSNVVCDVSLFAIEAPSRRLPPNDGLVSFIFPKTAAMLAINQSNALAEEFAMSPTDRDEIQDAALKRAAIQEASQLKWNEVEQCYELQHPAVARKNRDTNFVTSPLSPQGQTKPVLRFTVAKSDRSLQDKPVIIATGAASLRSPVLSAGPGVVSPITTSGDAEVQLASLDFNTNTLHLEAKNILDFMPSLFAIDSVVAALIAISVADPDTNGVMGGMPIWMPRPSKPNRTSWAGSQHSSSAYGGALYATIAEREEAEEEARNAAKIHRKSLKVTRKPTKLSELSAEPMDTDVEAGRTWYGKSKAKKVRKTKQIVISEFDLEKLTHYQSGARQGQELPAVTRGALSFMVSSLKFVVWFQTMIVQFLCWMLVAITRGVTSEKF